VSRTPEKPLLRCCGGGGLCASHLRPHATLLQVAVACSAAFVTVSITQKGSPAGVNIHSELKFFSVHFHQLLSSGQAPPGKYMVAQRAPKC